MAGLAKILNVLAGGLRLMAAALFVYSGAIKAADPAVLADSIDHYRLLPYFAIAPFALYLPWLEIICGLALGFGFARRGALAVLLVLTVIFTAAIGSAWLRGLDIDCGCFGGADPTPLYLAFARDLLLCGALLGLWRRETKGQASPSAPKEPRAQ
ncbi:MAG: DoxX family membrane protein [Verrucomicrobiota bacterium]|nr:DoxX family membrane protein [Verrucomicrobiota bacterium]